MKEETIYLEVELPVNADQLFKDWLDSERHKAFTGAEADIKEKLNFSYTTWDGYISGKILELEPGKRILHSWRTTEFSEKDVDSMLEIIIEPVDSDNSKLILKQWNLPEGQIERYKSGWTEYYFEPMKSYYN